MRRLWGSSAVVFWLAQVRILRMLQGIHHENLGIVPRMVVHSGAVERSGCYRIDSFAISFGWSSRRFLVFWPSWEEGCETNNLNGHIIIDGFDASWNLYWKQILKQSSWFQCNEILYRRCFQRESGNWLPYHYFGGMSSLPFISQSLGI